MYLQQLCQYQHFVTLERSFHVGFSLMVDRVIPKPPCLQSPGGSIMLVTMGATPTVMDLVVQTL